MLKKIIFAALTVFFAILIFQFSSQQALESVQLSTSITEAVLEQVPMYNELPLQEKIRILSITQEIARSFAHFLLFMFLGLFLILLLKCYPLKHPFILAILICIVYAITDEIHQEYFADGRAFQIIDLIKDWSGSLIGISIVALWCKTKVNTK